MTVSPSLLGAFVKIRFVAAATSVALLLLAACGGSESSTQDSTRTKNAALIQQTIPTTNNNSNTANSVNIQNKSCAQGGLCAVGDTGPGGGIVFYADAALQPWGQYMEVSKQTLDPNFDTMWCDVMPSQAFPNADALGNGRATTEFYAKPCKRGQLRMATDMVQGNYDDWHLPTLADAKQMYLVREKLQLEGEWHYTATPNLADGKKEAWAVYMVEEQIMSMNPEAGYAGRAIRTFAPRQVPSCANGDACKVGDIGPGGGIVFYAASTPQPWGQYMEVSSRTLDPRFDTMWCDVVPTESFPNADALGNGRAVSEFYAKPCKRGQLRMATDMAQGGFDDWHLPTLADAKQMYLVSKQLKIEGQWHYTATPDVQSKQAIALYMVDGQVKPMNPLAGFAGRATRTFGPKGTAPTTLAPTTVPLTTIAPTTLAPTTSAAAITTKGTTCATGGKCKVGDVGPAGGFVFHVSTASTGIETYLEAIPQRFGAGQQCDANTTKVPNAASLNIGDGLANTTAIYEVCTTGQSRSIIKNNKYYNRDWFIPTVGEMKAFVAQANAFKSPLVPNLSGTQCLWTSSGPALVPGKEMTILAMRGGANGTYYTDTPVSSACDVQPIRSFTSSAVTQSPVTTTPIATTPITTLTLPKKTAPSTTTTPPTTAAPTTTSTVAATTTSVKTQRSCAAGGICRLGETGPGGGVVFYVADQPQPWGQFLEATKFDMKSNALCSAGVRGLYASRFALGDGKVNTANIVRACKSGIAKDIDALVLNGKDDWYLPSRDEMLALYVARKYVSLSREFYYSSSQDAANITNAWTIYGVDGTPYPMVLTDARPARAIRAFGPTGKGLALKTQVDITQPCAKGGYCRIGDVGPGGGIVFYVGEYREPWGQFLEVAPTDTAGSPTFWCATAASVAIAADPRLGSGAANSFQNARNCQPGIGSLSYKQRLMGRDDWFVPSTLEAYYLIDATKRLAKTKLAASLIKQGSGICYWTSTDALVNNKRQAMYIENGVGFNKTDAERKACLLRLVRWF